MGRNQIHFCCKWPGKGMIISGVRKKCDVFIEVDIKKSMNDGIKWYKSKNMVILSNGINGTIST